MNSQQEGDAERASFSALMLGARPSRSWERTVPREVSAADHETLLVTVRRVLGQHAALGQPSSVGRTFSFTGGNQTGWIQVTVGPLSGSTLIRVDSSHVGLAGGLFGGIVGGVGGGIGPNVGWMLPTYAHTPVWVGVAAGGGFIVGTWLLVRSIFRSRLRLAHQTLGELVDALEAVVRKG